MTMMILMMKGNGLIVSPSSSLSSTSLDGLKSWTGALKVPVLKVGVGG
jgi:hypothetical protein